MRCAAFPVLLAICSSLTAAPPPSFDRDIQPLLLKCANCHGQSKARGDLRLDSRAAAIGKLPSGSQAIVPGKPDDSELLRRVGSSDPMKRMPPRGDSLSQADVEKLRRWIAAGADWPPRWAYRPLVRPAPPSLPASEAAARLQAWPRNSIDRFILKELLERGLAPAPEADRRTLLRRLHVDVVGLAPTAEEIDDFLKDPSPDAYEKVVDRLLASPQYGERWARHWMDAVHFAETHGHDQDRPRDHAWRYRDYLIRSFNADKPAARFIQEQVAGDVLFPDDPWALIATGFLAAGPWDESSLRDIQENSIDRAIGRYLDRDDVVSTVMGTFTSTTIHCARCHDHKFDPVTQEDYYALQAVFAGIDRANRLFDMDPAVTRRRRELNELKSAIAARKPDAVKLFREPSVQAEIAAWEKTVTRTAERWQHLRPELVKSENGATLTFTPADHSVLASGERPEKDTYVFVAKSELDTITAVRLELLTDPSLPHKGPGRQDNGNLHLNEFILTIAPAGEPAKSRTVSFAAARADFDQDGWTATHAIDANPATAWGIHPRVGEPHRAIFTLKEPLTSARGVTLTLRLEQSHGRHHLIGRFRLSLTSADKPDDGDALPAAVANALRTAAASRTAAQQDELAAYYLIRRVERDLAALPPPQQVYCGTPVFSPDGSFAPSGKPRPVHILKRGDIKNPGALAKPGTLALLPGLESRFALASPDDEGSRRAGLARWLTDERNGIVWRSLANRVWQHHFGRGIVETPADFGRMGSPPTHPELLDWLAVNLRENGSIKDLHRLMLISAAYRQSSRHHEEYSQIDADNRYLWRMNRRRLDAETIHDIVLQATGKLDTTMGGPSVRQFIMTPGIHVTPNVDYLRFDVDSPGNYRRSVYRFLFRTLPDPFQEALDCPDGSQSTPVRNVSITALQALAMLNDKFMVRQSEHLARRIAAETQQPERQVASLYRLVLGRSPTERESKAVTAYLAKYGLANACRVLMNSNEFVFAD